ATSESERRAVAADIFHRIGGLVVIPPVTNIRDGHIFTFSDTGFVVYQSPAIPGSIHWMILALEHDDDIRSVGETIESIVTAKDFGAIATALISMIRGTPHAALAAEVSRFVLQTVATRFR